MAPDTRAWRRSIGEGGRTPSNERSNPKPRFQAGTVACDLSIPDGAIIRDAAGATAPFHAKRLWPHKGHWTEDVR